MRKLPIAVFMVFLVSAIITGINSYRQTEHKIQQDLRKALAHTMSEMPGDRVDADTLHRYRNYITIDEVRDTACITVRTIRHGKKQHTEFVATAGCNNMTIFMLSDQRASGILIATGMLWILGSMFYKRRNVKVDGGTQSGMEYGGVLYYADKARFTTTNGTDLGLTPMQQQLMKMFFTAEDHTLQKQEICDNLWPKKPDASATLYTLIRRLKPVIEANSRLKVLSDRGKSYRLSDNG